jgi:hypothetical protein
MKYWINLAKQLGLTQAVLEYVTQVGDLDEDDLCSIFSVNKETAKSVLKDIIISKKKR